jgi:hypothetical protein
MSHVFNCPNFIRHRTHFKISLQQIPPVLFTIIPSFVFLCSTLVVIALLTCKIYVEKYTNNYIDTKCVIIRAVFTYYCDRERWTHDCDVTLLNVPAMFASRHGLMSEGSADDQWRQVFDDIMYNVIKGNWILDVTCKFKYWRCHVLRVYTAIL